MSENLDKSSSDSSEDFQPGSSDEYFSEASDLESVSGSSLSALGCTSRGTSPEYESEDGEIKDITGTSTEYDSADDGIEDKTRLRQSIYPEKEKDNLNMQEPNKYIRPTVTAEVQHCKPFKAAFAYIKTEVKSITKSRTSLTCALIIAILSASAIRSIFQPRAPLPVPDLVKVAGLARGFEPLIFYSENGIQQIDDLQATSEAIWDLGESIHSTNIISAPIIVKELDNLSESLKALVIQLTKFFASVDGDIDSILIVMDWAKRELFQLSSVTPSLVTSALNNLHSLLSRIGVLECPSGDPTKIGYLATVFFGQTSSQRSRRILQHTFHEFLSVLEESITNELAYSSVLFALFESINQQLINLARTVSRESDQQERQVSELLASLWTRVLGSNSAYLRKYEKNRQLLFTVHENVVNSKHILVDHEGKLLILKANLETLRRKLVSPLMRSDNSSTLSVNEQIKGLDSTYDYLSKVRETQKSKLMGMLYGASKREWIGKDEHRTYEIDGGERTI